MCEIDLNSNKLEYIVSACLAGEKCSYDGRDRLNDEVFKLAAEGRAIALCPEVMGGLPVPRTLSEIPGGDGAGVLAGTIRILNKDGEDVTEAFIKGAERFLEVAKTHGIKKAIMKAKSPSCGVGLIYDGSFSKRLIKGDGVTAALLKREGIEVEAR